MFQGHTRASVQIDDSLHLLLFTTALIHLIMRGNDFWYGVLSVLFELFLLALLGLDILGIVHSFKKHDGVDSFTSIICPPWALYRGVESFWHDKREEKLMIQEIEEYDKYDEGEDDLGKCTKIITDLMGSYQVGEIDQDELSKKVDGLREVFKGFSPSMVMEIENNSRKYAEYIRRLFEDILHSYESSEGDFSFTASEQTVELEAYLTKEKIKVRQLREQTVRDFGKAYEMLEDAGQKELAIDKMREVISSVKVGYDIVLCMIFGKED